MTLKTLQPKRTRNAAGFFAGGLWHPIRGGEGYDGGLAGDYDFPAERKDRKEANKVKAYKNWMLQEERRVEREMFGDATSDGKGKSLLQFVRGAGGLKISKTKTGKSYDAGEIGQLNYKQTGVRGLVAKDGSGRGKTLDGMYQAAREAGYNVADDNDLIGKIDDEIRSGKATYQTHGYLDYRDNPAKNNSMISKAKVKQIDAAARQLAKALPNATITQGIAVLKKLSAKKRKNNPSRRRGAAQAAFDFSDYSQNDQPAFMIWAEDLQKPKYANLKRIGREFNDTYFIDKATGKKYLIRDNPFTGTTRNAYERKFDRLLFAVEDGDKSKVAAAKIAGRLAGLKPAEISELIRRAGGVAKVKTNPKKILKRDVEKALIDYTNKLRRYGENNRATERAKWHWQDLAGEYKKNPAMHPIALFATGVNGILGALQLKKHLDGKPRAKRAGSVARNPVKYRFNPNWFYGFDTPEAVKQHYKSLAKKWHPDKAGGDLRTMQEINFEFTQAMNAALRNEPNEQKAADEASAAEPLREAIEFAMSLPDSVTVTIRGLWLWLEGDTYNNLARIKAFKSKDGQSFRFAGKKKAWYFAAVPSKNKGKEFSFEQIEKLHGKQTVKGGRKDTWKLNPSSLTIPMLDASFIKGLLNKAQYKKVVEWMLKAKDVTRAEYNRALKNVSMIATPATKQNPARKKRAAAAPSLFPQVSTSVLEFEDEDFPAMRKHLTFDEQGEENTYFIDRQTGQRYYTKGINVYNEFAKRRKNPASLMISFWIDYKKKFGATRFYNHLKSFQYSKADAFKISKAVHNATRKANPATIAKRKAFEMFNGRPATNVSKLNVSDHAPAKLDQAGDLVEIKLIDGRTLDFTRTKNGKTVFPYKLCMNPAATRLWIAGGRIATPAAGAKKNEVNPIEGIDHVVYNTWKPHHGDKPDTHYIHLLGEETGDLPLLCADKDGMPVISGGKYTIEERGIVN